MRPMKSATCEDQHLELIRWPVLASIKLDGFRCPIMGGKALSSSLKPIRNKHIFNTLSSDLLEGLDGELCLADEGDRNTPGKHEFSLVSSAVTAAAGTPDFIYWVFDIWDSKLPCVVRMSQAEQRISQLPAEVQEYVKWLPHVLCESLEEYKEFEDWCLDNGYEGTMINSVAGFYKFGEGTLKEQILLKRKPFADDECRVTGFVEQMENTNEATTDALGHTKRSSKKAGMVPKGTLGKFTGYSKKWGELNIGKGKMSAARAQMIWDTKYTPQAEVKIGDIITFKYQQIGTKDKPRIAIFKSVRHPDDLTPEKLEAI